MNQTLFWSHGEPRALKETPHQVWALHKTAGAGQIRVQVAPWITPCVARASHCTPSTALGLCDRDRGACSPGPLGGGVQEKRVRPSPQEAQGERLQASASAAATMPTASCNLLTLEV